MTGWEVGELNPARPEVHLPLLDAVAGSRVCSIVPIYSRSTAKTAVACTGSAMFTTERKTGRMAEKQCCGGLSTSTL